MENDRKVVDFSRTVDIARPDEEPKVGSPLRVAVAAMVSPKETFIHYRELLGYLGGKLGKDVRFIQRKTYGEVNELLGKGEIDIAFICSGPYTLGKSEHGLELLAVPEINGSRFYRSYLIVNKDSPYADLDDLRGRTFAFTDPDSNTGKLIPTAWLQAAGETPERFFGKVVMTYSHDNSIMAVAEGLVDGAAVDGLIWEFYRNRDPKVTASTRIIKRSEDYGMPPIVASRGLAADLKHRARDVFLSMHEDEKGKAILDKVMIDRFVEPRDEWYDGIRVLLSRTARPPGVVHAPEKHPK